MPTYRVRATDQGRRLDQVLASRFGLSRSFWQKELKAGRVLVDGQAQPARFLVSSRQTVRWQKPSARAKRRTELDLPVVYQDKDLMVINKPPGLLVHPPAVESNQPSVVDFSRSRTKDPDPIRPGIVHRLDRDASGLLLLAKTAAAKTELQSHFAKHQVAKTYLVLVTGRLKADQATINLPLRRRHSKPARQSIDLVGRPAVTHYRVLEELPGYSLVEARPETGRTHQLRVHFAALGHPLAGDKWYGGRAGSPRLFLHASGIELVGPSGQKIKLASDLPPDLAKFLGSVRKAV